MYLVIVLFFVLKKQETEKETEMTNFNFTRKNKKSSDEDLNEKIDNLSERVEKLENLIKELINRQNGNSSKKHNGDKLYNLNHHNFTLFNSLTYTLPLQYKVGNEYYNNVNFAWADLYRKIFREIVKINPNIIYDFEIYVQCNLLINPKNPQNYFKKYRKICEVNGDSVFSNYSSFSANKIRQVIKLLLDKSEIPKEYFSVKLYKKEQLTTKEK